MKTNTQWNNLFHEYEQQGKTKANSMSEQYFYLGEIDCPGGNVIRYSCKIF